MRDRHLADACLANVQRLIEDRRLVFAAIDDGSPVPIDLLERHGWLAVEEARLNVRDAPASWTRAQAAATAVAAAAGADWLESLDIPRPGASA